MELYHSTRNDLPSHAKWVATHANNERMQRSSEYHLGRARENRWLLDEEDQQQDHAAHAATRLLMALTLRGFEQTLGRNAG